MIDITNLNILSARSAEKGSSVHKSIWKLVQPPKLFSELDLTGHYKTIIIKYLLFSFVYVYVNKIEI